ncbi:MAG: hypothetical protein WCY19_03075 [Candidatus Gastranaerophilaceae bacterium]
MERPTNSCVIARVGLSAPTKSVHRSNPLGVHWQDCFGDCLLTNYSTLVSQ